MTWKDLRTLVKAALNFQVLWYLFGPSNWFKKAEHPGEF